MKYGLVLTITTLFFLAGCGSSEVVTNLPPEERFAKAKQLFDDEDYLEAINEFTVITLQYQGSSVAADAQFYLAEARFMRHEYLLASYEYQTLKRNMGASSRVPEAQYKLGLCFYNLSPKSRLDQQYTKKAIDELQAYVEYYPNDARVGDATEKIRELTTRLAKKEYDSAELYATLDYHKAALAYYDNVIEKYHDTEYAPLSYLGKTELLMGRKKYREAKVEITRFLDRFPNSVLRSRGDKLNEQIDSELKSLPSVNDTTSGGASNSSNANLLRTN
ncbi:MAG: outer membrane protein assembly factor BamD [Ignavibacteriae bacterium]|nr:outer membrane protein assembly factor BamD [Ignavibacteriota bacterium]